MVHFAHQLLGEEGLSNHPNDVLFEDMLVLLEENMMKTIKSYASNSFIWKSVVSTSISNMGAIKAMLCRGKTSFGLKCKNYY